MSSDPLIPINPVEPEARRIVRRVTPPLSDVLVQLGGRIRSLRTHAGLSQADLGRPYISRAAVSAIEKGRAVGVDIDGQVQLLARHEYVVLTYRVAGIHAERDTKRPRSLDVQFREPTNSGSEKHVFRQFVDWARRKRILPRFGINSVDIDNVRIVGWRLARSGLSIY